MDKKLEDELKRMYLDKNTTPEQLTSKLREVKEDELKEQKPTSENIEKFSEEEAPKTYDEYLEKQQELQGVVLNQETVEGIKNEVGIPQVSLPEPQKIPEPHFVKVEKEPEFLEIQPEIQAPSEPVPIEIHEPEEFKPEIPAPPEPPIPELDDEEPEEEPEIEEIPKEEAKEFLDDDKLPEINDVEQEQEELKQDDKTPSGYDQFKQDEYLSEEEARAKIATMLANRNNLEMLSELNDFEIFQLSVVVSIAQKYEIPIVKLFTDNMLGFKVSRGREGRREIKDVAAPVYRPPQEKRGIMDAIMGRRFG